MARPCKKRRICGDMKEYSLKPCAQKGKRSTGIVQLSGDEIEALRLADYLCKYQADAAKMMNVSRPTFGRIVESARKKVSDALVNAKEIRISCCGPVEQAKKEKKNVR